jgi:hypothetical protein
MPATRENKPDYFNLSDKLRKEKRITPEFEVMMNTLTLEELIGLKIELSAGSTKSKLYGFKVWRSIPYIAREALLMYVYTHSPTVGDAASLLGISTTEYYELLYRFEIQKKFKKKEKELTE